jgi:hypothetical protein
LGLSNLPIRTDVPPIKELYILSGLYLPKSHRELQEQKRAQMDMDKYARSRPDFEDSRQLEMRLRLRDPAMAVVWAHEGPHANRWIVLRTDGQGLDHVVSVIKHEDGSYKRPDPALAETFIDLWGSAGNRMLREIEAAEAKRYAEAERIEDENHQEIAERIASLVINKHGSRDNALFTSEKTKALN